LKWLLKNVRDDAHFTAKLLMLQRNPAISRPLSIAFVAPAAVFTGEGS
jgi:hypothetical protein